MAHPAWFGGPKTPKQQEETLKTGIKLALVVAGMMIVIALIQDWVKDQFSKLIDYTPTKATSEFVIEHDEAE
jgi:type III secretory pathway component EscS